MESSGFSSPRSDYFPAGLRVLVVDDDRTWLKILERMLKKCNYEVTICNLAQEALNLLRERKDGFDLVISDVNMPDMDGFKLLELVGLEMDLPVIIMSVDGETSRVMKGVQHGACDYLLKPVRLKEIRNIWQHVFRKRINELRDIEGHESIDEQLYMMRNTEKSSDDGSDHQTSGKKRKDEDRVVNAATDSSSSSSSSKKSRLVWTVELHQKFVKAVNQIGLDKVGPKKVRDLMGVSWITRENVASHLQKYRLYLNRLQKENDIKATGDGDDVFVQNSVPNNESSNGAPGNVKMIHPMPMAESKKALYGDVIDSPKSNSTSGISFGEYSVPKPEEAKIPNPRPSSMIIKEADSTALFSLEAQSQQIPYHHPMWNHNLDHYNNMFDYVERNTIQRTGNGFSLLGSRMWDDGEFNSFSCGIGNLEESIIGSCSNQEELGPGPHVPPKLFDSIILDDCEYPFDPVEYPMMDQGVHIL